jgi:hypothetical protein
LGTILLEGIGNLLDHFIIFFFFISVVDNVLTFLLPFGPVCFAFF